MGNKWCAPIPSRTVEDKIESYLMKSDICYAALFRFCIVTGMLINKALDLKIGDLKENGEFKTSFIVENFSHNIPEYNVALDEHTISLLKKTCADRDDNAYVFIGKVTHSKLNRATFQKRLAIVAQKCGLTDITPKSLRKTHILHIYKTYGLQRAKHVSGFPSVGIVFEYLNLEEEYNYSPSYERNLLMTNDYGKNLIEEIIGYLKQVETRMYDKTNPDVYYLNLSNDLTKIKDMVMSYSQKE